MLNSDPYQSACNFHVYFCPNFSISSYLHHLVYDLIRRNRPIMYAVIFVGFVSISYYVIFLIRDLNSWQSLSIFLSHFSFNIE